MLTGIVSPTASPRPTLKGRAHSLLAKGEEKLRSAIKSLQLTPEKTEVLSGPLPGPFATNDIVRSFRAAAMMASFFGLPSPTSRLRKALSV